MATRVYAAGVFDIIHYGHIRYLQSSKKLGDELIVGLLSDEGVEKYKGRKPLLSYENRHEVLQSLKIVDYIVRQEDTDPTETLRIIKNEQNWKIDILTRGDDYVGIPPGTEFIEANGGKVVRIPYTKEISSSTIKDNANILKMKSNPTQIQFKKTLLKFVHYLNKYNIPYWLHGGTLLGLCRDEQFLDNEKDIDIGIFQNVFLNLKNIYEFRKTLEREGVIFSGGIHNAEMHFHDSETNVMVDLCLFTRVDDYNIELYYYKTPWGGYFFYPLTCIEPIDTKVFPCLDNIQICVPYNYEQFLQIHYGKDWKTPKTSIEFQKEYPNWIKS